MRQHATRRDARVKGFGLLSYAALALAKYLSAPYPPLLVLVYSESMDRRPHVELVKTLE